MEADELRMTVLESHRQQKVLTHHEVNFVQLLHRGKARNELNGHVARKERVRRGNRGREVEAGKRAQLRVAVHFDLKSSSSRGKDQTLTMGKLKRWASQ